MSLRVGGLFLDYSKHQVSDEVLTKLIELADHSALVQRRAQMFSGDIINVTENRPVLHTALRHLGDEPVYVDGEDVMPEITRTREQIKLFSEAVRSGEWKGYNGQRIKDVVNIGIGGSDLGPNMAVRALVISPPGYFHFVSNVDGTHIQKVLSRLDGHHPIVSTTTFSPNPAQRQDWQRWFLKHLATPTWARTLLPLPPTAKRRWSSYSRRERVRVLGLWGPLLHVVVHRLTDCALVGFEGLSSCWKVPMDGPALYRSAFRSKHAGTDGADRHLFIGFIGAETQAIVPYDQALSQLPSFLQQLDMESTASRWIFSAAVNYKPARLCGAKPAQRPARLLPAAAQGTALCPSIYRLAQAGTGRGRPPLRPADQHAGPSQRLYGRQPRRQQRA